MGGREIAKRSNIYLFITPKGSHIRNIHRKTTNTNVGAALLKRLQAREVHRQFLVCSEDDVRRIITASPTKSCTPDPIPIFLLKEPIDPLLPFLTTMINASLREGCLPASQKHAIIMSLLKKPSLDDGEMKNYCPVSKLTFISKVVDQVVRHLHAYDLLPCLQLAYWRH